MHVTVEVWVITIIALAAVLVVDLAVIGRRPHEPSMREAGLAIGIYSGLAVLFGVWVWLTHGGQYAGEFFAGWITEYSLSVDNLFIFVLIMSKQRVPRQLQQFALMVGVVIALVLRAIFIAAGAAVIELFSWVFFLFGAFLIYTAVKLFLDFRSHADEEAEATDNAFTRWVQPRVRSVREFHGSKLFVRLDGKVFATSMLFVVLALGSTDLLFALDSIPAIYGLTQEPYLVFTANVFALMGLRQLYFLIGGLLQRLVYLTVGLSVILAFIGVKLVLHAMHEYGLDHFLGFSVDIPIWVSLLVIIATLAVTTVASLAKSRRDAGLPRRGPNPKVWAVASLVANMGIVVTGGLVRVTGSGLGCPTWPQCSPGSYIPHEAATGHALIEFGNRTLTFVLLIIAIGMVISAWRTRDGQGRPRRLLRGLAVATLVGILTQAVIGGLLVWSGLNPWGVAIHLVPSIALIVICVGLVQQSWSLATVSLERRDQGLVWATAIVGVVVMLLGAVVTGAGPNSGDGAAIRNGLDLVFTARIHSLSVWLVVGLSVLALIRLRRTGARRAVQLLLLAELFQAAVGYAQFALALPSWLVALHMVGTVCFTAALANLWWLTCGPRNDQATAAAVDPAELPTTVSAEPSGYVSESRFVAGEQKLPDQEPS